MTKHRTKPAANYVGRFAPSPSGPLHMGSLVCALASWLDARSHNGTWLVRIEDLDPPREQPGADQKILECLCAHGLLWDGPVIYQSQRHSAYRESLANLAKRQLSYRCSCTRARLKIHAGNYDRHCWRSPPISSTACAVRLHMTNALTQQALPLDYSEHFRDGILGLQRQSLGDTDDFVIHRKDGLFAYQLAVVVDDIAQQITEVVRGADLLSTTAQQRLLFQLMGSPPPNYSHIPIITDAKGNKLSKQNHAPAIDNKQASDNLLKACQLLGLPDDIRIGGTKTEDILERATRYWQRERVPNHPAQV